MKFRKKPIVIDAFKWTGDVHQVKDPDWIVEAIEIGAVTFSDTGSPNVKLLIVTLEGTMAADCGDYVIRGIKGEIYPCKPDIFEASYEPAE